MNNFPLLSICVLTFNRKAHIVRILEFLKDEYQSLENKDVIEIIISDNNSTDGTDNFIREFINKNKLRKWIYNKNTKNTGLLGNLLKSEELATGKYLWWWGDDDHYKKGIIKAVMNHIKKNPDYIFLNHCASRQNAWDGLAFKNALENLGLSKNPTIMDIIKKSPGTIMFISASIYNRVRLNTLHSKEYKKNISLPLLYSLFCSARGNYIIDKNIWIDDNFKEISWSD